MIIPTEKYFFIGPLNSIHSFFTQAQRVGILQFIDPNKAKKIPLSEEASLFLEALHVLREKEPLQVAKKTRLSAKEIAKITCATAKKKKELLEKKRLLEIEAARIRIFGDFDEQEIHYLAREAGRFVQFYSVKSSVKKEKIPKDMIYIGKENDLEYFIGIHKEKKSFPGYIEMIIEKPLGLVLCDLKDVKKSMEEQDRILEKQAGYISILQAALQKQRNEDALCTNKSFTSEVIEDKVFAVEAYVPKTKQQALQKLLRDFPIYAEAVDFDPEEISPTYMENKGWGKVGEDLVHVYDTPSAEDKDPSAWVFWFFCFFYAVIISDAGYGFLYFLLALFLWKKFPSWTGAKKRFRTLIFTLSIFCMGWGAITSSYFGIDFAPDHPLKKISLIQILAEKKAEYHKNKNDEIYNEWLKKHPEIAKAQTGKEFLLLAKTSKNGKHTYTASSEFANVIFTEIALLIGVIHLLTSFFRNASKSISGLGWAVSMIGGYLYFPKILQASSILQFTGLLSAVSAHFYGEILLYSGVFFAVLVAILSDKWVGIFELTNAIQVFADVLSYLRLYALGLAGMLIADTCNQMGAEFGPFFGFLILFLGHSVNILLGMMSGVIHGLRLNFLEWYHYCFEGGGKLFNPLRLLQK